MQITDFLVLSQSVTSIPPHPGPETFVDGLEDGKSRCETQLWVGHGRCNYEHRDEQQVTSCMMSAENKDTELGGKGAQ